VILLLLGGAAAIALYKLNAGGEVNSQKRLYNMRDVDPNLQGGNYSKTYDIYFESYAEKYGVPFVLMKAIAIQESALNPAAFRDESDTGPNRQGWGSRGLLQLLWWPGSNRFAKYGYPDSKLGVDAIMLFDPNVNIEIGAQLIRDNIHACKGNVRDTINMHNTGVKEEKRQAPLDYVNKIMKHYNKMLGA